MTNSTNKCGPSGLERRSKIFIDETIVEETGLELKSARRNWMYLDGDEEEAPDLCGGERGTPGLLGVV